MDCHRQEHRAATMEHDKSGILAITTREVSLP